MGRYAETVSDADALGLASLVLGKSNDSDPYGLGRGGDRHGMRSMQYVCVSPNTHRNYMRCKDNALPLDEGRLMGDGFGLASLMLRKSNDSDPYGS